MMDMKVKIKKKMMMKRKMMMKKIYLNRMM